MESRYRRLWRMLCLLLAASFAESWAYAQRVSLDLEIQLSLGLPVKCVMGSPLENVDLAPDGPPVCSIIHYVDHDVSAGERDYKGGMRTYSPGYKERNFHRGTDFAILDRRQWFQMEEPLPIIAAAKGIVSGVRDGRADYASIDGPACGNAVLIDHGSGLFSQYCHLQKGSVKVTRNAPVKKGDVLGYMGASGRANFPHLHFGVFKKIGNKAQYLDPFLPGKSPDANMGFVPRIKWDDEALALMPYEPVLVLKAGFLPRKAGWKYLREEARPIPKISWNAFSPILPTLYVTGAQKGYRIAMEVRTPAGDKLLSGTYILAKQRVRDFLTADLRESKSFKDYMIRKGRAPLGSLLLLYQVRDADNKVILNGQTSAELVE